MKIIIRLYCQFFVTGAPSEDHKNPFVAKLFSNKPTDFNANNSLSTGSHVMRSAARSVDYSVGCGETKGCFRDDDGSLVTFAMSLDGQYLNIEMQTDIGTADYDWIAVGFATSTDMVSLNMPLCLMYRVQRMPFNNGNEISRKKWSCSR